MILRVPPETLWPTGATPPELRAVMHANGQLTPEELQAQRAVAPQVNEGIENYVPPPRPTVNRAELEAERQSLRLVESVSPELPSAAVPRGTGVQRYLVPLSHSVNAEIIIHGRAGPRDYKLLQKYVKLMSSVELPVELTYKSSPPPVEVSFKKPRKSYAEST